MWRVTVAPRWLLADTALKVGVGCMFGYQCPPHVGLVSYLHRGLGSLLSGAEVILGPGDWDQHPVVGSNIISCFVVHN
jgi:hypothetical protein